MFVAVEILIALIVPGLVFVITACLRSRERLRLLNVILETSQSGHPVSPELLRTLPGGRELPAPQVDFRRGVMLIAMRGLWTFATWGWWLTVACLLVGVALNVIPMMHGIFTTRINLMAVFDAAFLAYVFTPQIRSFYTGGPPDVSAAA